MKSTITSNNEQEINEAIKAMEQEKDMMAYVTFMINAKSIEFKLDDGTNSATKQTGVINSINTIAEGVLSISTSPPEPPGDEVMIKIFIHENRLVLESDKIPIVLQKR